MRTNEIDTLATALEVITRGAYRGSYTRDPLCGAYLPAGWQPDFSDYFTL